jgi:hypothetical protein
MTASPTLQRAGFHHAVVAEHLRLDFLRVLDFEGAAWMPCSTPRSPTWPPDSA